MLRLQTIVAGLRALFRKEQTEREMDEELRAYLDAAVKEKMRAGMSAEEALRSARVEMGSLEGVKEEIRSAGWESTLETFWQDLRYGLRQLRRSPGFTLVAVITLALGIGANTAMFSVVNAVLLRPLPYKDPAGLFEILSSHKLEGRWTSYGLSLADFVDLEQQTSTLMHLAAFTFDDANLTGRGGPERLSARKVTPSLFELLGVTTILGRTFLPGENAPGRDQVVILSHALWQRRFGGDAAVLGKTIDLNDRAYTVVGVLPPGLRFPDWSSESTDVWIPFAIVPSELNRRFPGATYVYARLKDGATAQQARAQLNAVASGLAQKYPDTDKGLKLALGPLRPEVAGGVRRSLLILFVAVGFVLLIGCANLANLLLARNAGRQREIAVRQALGAGRARITRQFLTESLLLAVVGGGMGLLLAHWGIGLVRGLGPSDIPRLDQANIDRSVLWFTSAVALLAGILFGLAPALQFSKPDLNSSLKEGMLTLSGGVGLLRARRTRSLLVIAEVALTLLLVVGSGLMIRSLWRLMTVDTGFDPRNVLTMTIPFGREKYRQPIIQTSFFQQILDRVRALPGVKSAALTNLPPLGGGVYGISFAIKGPSSGHEPEAPYVEYNIVSPEYFRMFGMRLLRGRDFTDRDVKDAPGVVIISEAFARRYWPDQNPLGKTVTLGRGDNAQTCEVIGVVSDVRDNELKVAPQPKVYVPYLQVPVPEHLLCMSLLVRTASKPLKLANAIRSQIWAVDSDQPLVDVMPLEQLITSENVAGPRFRTFLLAAFAGLALVLALVGIYGVVSYTVAQRTHEIGIRVALGADQKSVLKLVIGQGLLLVGGGLGCGLVAALGLTRLLSSLLYEVSPTDPVTLVAVSLMLGCAALLACYIPARRATKVDPIVALRYE
jgi:putative ABC transport system permease protein